MSKKHPHPSEIRYAWRTGQKYRYQYSMKADLMGQAITGEGEIAYSPEQPDGSFRLLRKAARRPAPHLSCHRAGNW